MVRDISTAAPPGYSRKLGSISFLTRLLFATASGGRHEFGTLGAAMLAASSGLRGTCLVGLPGRVA